jgi:hypothetical protein
MLRVDAQLAGAMGRDGQQAADDGNASRVASCHDNLGIHQLIMDSSTSSSAMSFRSAALVRRQQS